jgi:hypothetical protein
MHNSEMRRSGRGVQTYEPVYFDNLSATGDKLNSDKTSNKIANGK